VCAPRPRGCDEDAAVPADIARLGLGPRSDRMKGSVEVIGGFGGCDGGLSTGVRGCTKTGAAKVGVAISVCCWTSPLLMAETEAPSTRIW
jgi:hypothetical protein